MCVCVCVCCVWYFEMNELKGSPMWYRGNLSRSQLDAFSQDLSYEEFLEIILEVFLVKLHCR